MSDDARRLQQIGAGLGWGAAIAFAVLALVGMVCAIASGYVAYTSFHAVQSSMLGSTDAWPLLRDALLGAVGAVLGLAMFSTSAMVSATAALAAALATNVPPQPSKGQPRVAPVTAPTPRA